MINTVSQKFLDIVKGDGRSFREKIVIDNKEYTEFRELKLTKSCESGDSLSFGSCFSSSLTATIPNFPKNNALAHGIATLYVGLKIDVSLDSFDDLNAYEWVKLGTFNISESKFNDDELKITAYDNFYLCEKVFASNLSGLQKIKTIVNEQCSKLGITYIDDIEDVSYNIDVLKGLTIREAFSYLASYLGKNAIFNEDGKLQFIWYSKINKTISADRFTSPLTVGEYDTVINSITCITKESITNENGGIETKDKNITVGSGDGITFSNLYMTEARLNSLLNRIKGFTFRSCEMNWIVAEPNVQIGDIVTIEDLEHVYTVPIMNMEMSFDGGCNATIKSKYKVKEADRFEGSLSKKVERNYQEYASFKEVIAEKVTAFEGDFTKVNTDILNVNKELIAVKGSIKDLNVDELVTRVATIETSYVDKQYVNENYVGIQYANTTYAVKSEVKDLTADVAKINTLLSGSVTAGSTQTIVLNAENTTIANALIKDAMIDTLNFNKIIGIDINTTKLNVHSNDGLSTWKDNTILIKDSKRTRVQIGKDAQGDYNIYIWDKNGKVMFDPLGLTADGVNREVIDNSNVKPNAGIKGSKLDIDSVITEVNGATTTIKSSRIYFDEKKQTLDVAFNSMQTSVSTVTKTITDNKSKWDTASTNASNAVTTANQAKSTAESANTNASNALNKASSVETRANNGEFDGRGVGQTSVAYQASTNGTVAPTGTWTSTIPSVPAGQYLWTRTTIMYTDGTTDYIYTVAKMGANGTNGSKGDKGDTGATGNGISSITNYYLASASASGVTVSTSGWTTTPQSVSTSKKYHWSYQIIAYTNGNKTTTTPAIIGVYGDTGAQGAQGATGKGIKSVTPQYYLSTSSTTQSGGSWKTTQDTWSSGKYYWTRDSIVWSDNTTTYTTPTLDVGLNTANANALNAITKVTTVEETVKTQSTQITTAQGQISTLITDVTQAKKDITATKGDVTTAKANITTLTNNYSSIKQTVDGLNSTVGSHTSQLTTIKGTADSALSLINNLSIGGRNYIVLGKITSYTPYNTIPTVNGDTLTTTWNASYTGNTFTIAISGFSPKNKVYTLSGYLKVNGTIPTAKYFIDRASTYGSSLQKNEYDPKTGYFAITQTYSGSNNWILHGSTTRKSGSTDVVTIEKLKFEEGNKATDWTPAPEDVDTSISTVNGRVTAEIKKVTDKQSVFENTINGIASRVSSTETSITTVTKTVEDTKNLATNAKTIADSASTNASSAKTVADQAKTSASSAVTTANTAKTTADTAKSTADSAKTTATTASTNASNAVTTANGAKSVADTAKTLADSKAKIFTATPTTPYKVGDLWTQGTSGVIMRCKTARASGAYVASDWEKADKYTDDTTANKVRTDLTATIKTVTDKQATFETTLNGITSRVSSTESNITTINGNITSLTTRMSSAEQKITNDAIVSTVRNSTSYKNDLTGKVSTNSIVSSINQTAEKIKIDANKIDLSGYVTITNGLQTFKNTIDLSSSSYDANTYYPVVGTAIPSGGYHLYNVDVQLNSGTKPSWSTHSGGFTCNLAVRVKANGWGTTQNGMGWIDDETYAFCDKMPARFYQMTNSSLPVLFLRGGGRYFVRTDYACTWSIKTSAFTSNSQTVQPIATPPAYNQLSKWSYDSDTTYINGGKIYARTVTADKINVNSLSAISANIGNVTAGTITGVTITGGSITSNTTINVNTNLTVGDNIYVGQNQGSGITNRKRIYFTEKSFIDRITMGSSELLTMVGGTVSALKTYGDKAQVRVYNDQATMMASGSTQNSSEVSVHSGGVTINTFESNRSIDIYSASNIDISAEGKWAIGTVGSNGSGQWLGFYQYGGNLNRKAWIGHDGGTAFYLWNEAGEDFIFTTTQGWLRAYATNGDGCFNFRTDLSTFWFAQKVSVAGLINRSREKYKTNIVGFDNALKLINDSKVYEYNLKEELQKGTKQQHYGFIIERETPQEIINGDGVDVYSLASINWQGTKELAHITNVRLTMHDQEIQELKNENARLQQELKNTQAKLDAFISGNFEFKTVKREVV